MPGPPTLHVVHWFCTQQPFVQGSHVPGPHVGQPPSSPTQVFAGPQIAPPAKQSAQAAPSLPQVTLLPLSITHAPLESQQPAHVPGPHGAAGSFWQARASMAKTAGRTL